MNVFNDNKIKSKENEFQNDGNAEDENEMKQIEDYFYNETKDFTIINVTLVETKYSYFDTVNCYQIQTDKEIIFYVYKGSVMPMNLYPARNGETITECYYKHIGFMAELCSNSLSKNFILDFLDNNSIFPILDRLTMSIGSEITLEKNSNQLKGLANQIRDCYITLSKYLMNKHRSNSPNYKDDNFTDNLEEFLQIILPGKESEKRRNLINTIAKKGWSFNAELVHKNTVTVFDVLISFNTMQLVVSSISNLVVGDEMPFNKIKCPNCKSEDFTMFDDRDLMDYTYTCTNCNNRYSVNPEVLKRKI